MLPDLENNFRDHWPHHYRDILDKLESPLGTVVVTDTHSEAYPHPRPLMRLEKSFTEPTVYDLTVQNPETGEAYEQRQYDKDSLAQAIREFAEAIGGWKPSQTSS